MLWNIYRLEWFVIIITWLFSMMSILKLSIMSPKILIFESMPWSNEGYSQLNIYFLGYLGYRTFIFLYFFNEVLYNEKIIVSHLLFLCISFKNNNIYIDYRQYLKNHYSKETREANNETLKYWLELNKAVLSVADW